MLFDDLLKKEDELRKARKRKIMRVSGKSVFKIARKIQSRSKKKK